MPIPELIISFLQTRLLGIPLIDAEALLAIFLRFAFNMAVITIIVRYIYYPITHRKDYLFTYILIGMVVFLLCFLLESVKLQIGFALGLFAIFGIIRYRTDTIAIKEMTYLFIIIGLSVINALANKKISYSELLLANSLVAASVYGLEKVWLLRHESVKSIVYEKIELIKPERRDDLKKDLEARTGLNINRIEIGRIDFLNDTARLKIYFFDDENHFEDHPQPGDDD
jgi:hypothetical protein